MASGQALRYAAHRLRFFALGQVLGIGVHVVELLYLKSLFVVPSLVPVFVTQSACLIVQAAWWGLLEEMRVAIRDANRRNERRKVERLVSNFLSTSVVAALFVLLVAIVSLEPRRLWEGGGSAALEVYKVLAGVRLAAQLVVRTYHSSVFALRRVHRPFSITFGADLVALLFLPLLYRWLGAWALPWRFAVLAVFSVSVGLVYVRRARRELRFEEPRISLVSALNEPFEGIPASRILGAALAWGATQAGGALTLAAARNAGVDDGSHAFFFYLLAPILSASSSFGNLFYFDLSRFRERIFDALRERLLARLRVFALAWGTFAGLVGLGIAHLVLRKDAANTPWFLPVLAALLAAASLEQVRLFVVGRYVVIAQGIAGLLGGALLMAPARALGARFGDVVRTCSEFVVLSLAIIAVTELYRHKRSEGPASSLVPYGGWRQRLSAHPTGVSVRYARFRGRGRSPTLRFARALEDRFRDGGLVTCADRQTVLWFTRPEQALTTEDVLTMSAGLVHRTAELISASEGAKAAAEVERWGARERFAAFEDATLDSVRTAFLAAFPGAKVVRLGDDRAGVDTAGDSAIERVLVLRAAIADARLRTSIPKAQKAVIAWAPSQRLEAIFVVPADASPEARAAWRTRIHSAASRAGAVAP